MIASALAQVPRPRSRPRDTPRDAATSRRRRMLDVPSTGNPGDSLRLGARGLLLFLAWGGRLATDAGTDVAASVLRGDDQGLNPSERALARWARKVVITPNETSPADMADLRRAGFDDDQIFAITMFVALRLAFSMVNDSLSGAASTSTGSSGRPVDPSRPRSALLRRSATCIRVRARERAISGGLRWRPRSSPRPKRSLGNPAVARDQVGGWDTVRDEPGAFAVEVRCLLLEAPTGLWRQRRIVQHPCCA